MIEHAAPPHSRLEQQLACIVPSWSMAPVAEAYQARCVAPRSWLPLPLLQRPPMSVASTRHDSRWGSSVGARGALDGQHGSAGKKLPVLVAAIAREMAAFLWAIGRELIARYPLHRMRTRSNARVSGWPFQSDAAVHGYCEPDKALFIQPVADCSRPSCCAPRCRSLAAAPLQWPCCFTPNCLAA